MSEIKHTPLPWKWDTDTSSIVDTTNTVLSVDGISQPHGYVSEDATSRENARFITQACNAHYELLAALKEARAWMVHGTRQTPEQRGAKCETAYDAEALIEAAIAKAEGRE